ncbi:hypothetical protein [Lactobacillus acetotolerans]|jgi:uncharacterized membrane protein YfhO|uniref:Uncharacterized protein n=1 Tax=Lactobacillus acetotolerans TaxID=1600 RepID=A0A5P5ZGJ8_9LACO|nr:hypothetical protein [Lactobacillus acetotolerans]QFG50604.1 hypothetical protein LA749_00565 [Lactobacillus acetotolerans]QJD72748.1 hypothetical protein HG715_01740 [Lactobacillus acetotolerans]GGV19111.1 hypothetical protein GCM10011628_15140 [Lactobacillus acetotolerans DSM 20749 = JCM 3825]HBG90557.1 hypothetical protein [Lactobacillus acetotolerans]
MTKNEKRDILIEVVIVIISLFLLVVTHKSISKTLFDILSIILIILIIFIPSGCRTGMQLNKIKKVLNTNNKNIIYEIYDQTGITEVKLQQFINSKGWGTGISWKTRYKIEEIIDDNI